MLRRIVGITISPTEYVVVYMHQENQVVALVKIACDTDFVAHSDALRFVANKLVRQVVATVPIGIEPEGDSDSAQGCLLTQE